MAAARHQPDEHGARPDRRRPRRVGRTPTRPRPSCPTSRAPSARRRSTSPRSRCRPAARRTGASRPVKKLAGLLAEGATGRLDWTTKLPAGVTTSTITSEQAPALGVLPPQDRAAVVAGAAADGALLLDIPAEAELDEPVVRLARRPGRRARPRPPRRRARALLQGRRSSSSTPARRALPARLGRHRRRLRPHRRVGAALGRRRPCTCAARRPRRSRRPLQAPLGDASAARSSASTPTCVTPAPAATRPCSASTSPTPASTSSTARTSTTTRRTARAGHLQGRAPGRDAPTPSGSATC